jgi:hypothetical protein
MYQYIFGLISALYFNVVRLGLCLFNILHLILFYFNLQSFTESFPSTLYFLSKKNVVYEWELHQTNYHVVCKYIYLIYFVVAYADYRFIYLGSIQNVANMLHLVSIPILSMLIFVFIWTYASFGWLLIYWNSFLILHINNSYLLLIFF